MNQKIILHFRKSDPILYSVIEKIGLIKIHQKSLNYFACLCEIIINQQLSDKASSTIFNKFKCLFPYKKISPSYLLTIPDEKIRMTGPSRNKVSFMKELAVKINTNELDLDSLDGFSDEEVKIKLLRLKGVGNWTTEMFLMVGLGREDIFSPGDLGLRKAIQKLYKLKKEPTLKQMKKISHKWIPYRTYASRILWKSLE